MINVAAVLIILILFCGAIIYIVKAKKQGVKCIGCPSAGTCSSAHGEGKDGSGCGGCHGCDISYEEIREKVDIK